MRYYNWESERIAIVYSFARIFRAMSCNAMRIKLLRRPGGLMITPRFPWPALILVFVFPSLAVGVRPQITLVFISGTRRSYLERKLLTDSVLNPDYTERTNLNRVIGLDLKEAFKGNRSALGVGAIDGSRPRSPRFASCTVTHPLPLPRSLRRELLHGRTIIS